MNASNKRLKSCLAPSTSYPTSTGISVDFFVNVHKTRLTQLGTSVGNLSISAWIQIFSVVDICALATLSRVCTIFHSHIAAFSFSFAPFTGIQLVEYWLPPSIILGTQDLTFFAKVKPTANKYGMIFARDICADSKDQFRFEMNADRHVAVTGFGISGIVPSKVKRSRDPNGYGSEIISPYPLPLNIFTRVCMMRQGPVVSLFIDGALVYWNRTHEVYNFTTTNRAFRVGSRHEYVKHDEMRDFFPGEIKKGRLWFRALSNEDIASLF